MHSFSLLIPCHNAAQYLPRLWETVKAQTIPFDEIICYDDGSTDNTSEVAKSLGAKVIRSYECHGAAHARNELAKASTSNWIHFHDADDILHPRYLEQSKAAIQQNVDVIVCQADWVDEVSRQVLIPRRYNEHQLKKDAIRETIVNPIGVISCLYRKQKFLEINGFDVSLPCWEDGDLNVRFASVGASFAVVNEVLSFSLRHDRGLSANQHVCNCCRLKLLKQYARVLDDGLKPVIAQQAEITAVNLLRLSERSIALDAVNLCRELGVNPPTSKNFLLRVLKPIIPVLWLLQIQSMIRSSN